MLEIENKHTLKSIYVNVKLYMDFQVIYTFKRIAC